MSEKRYLSQLYIYPIKSLPGIRMYHADVQQKGLKHDRRWMLVDMEDRFITVRKNKDLYKFHLTQTSFGFSVETTLHKSSIQIPFELDEGKQIKATIWDDQVLALEGNQGWNEWFSDALQMPCRLVHLPENSPRPIKQKWQVNNESVSLADGYPYLVIGQASLDALNKKLGMDLSVKRFRPNLVFKGGSAYEEFRFADFTVGEVSFKGLKPCVRCVVTTIDPETGEGGVEPLKTLARQKIDDKVVFGQHAIALMEGHIKVGDPIEIISTKESPYDPLQ